MPYQRYMLYFPKQYEDDPERPMRFRFWFEHWNMVYVIEDKETQTSIRIPEQLVTNEHRLPYERDFELLIRVARQEILKSVQKKLSE